MKKSGQSSAQVPGLSRSRRIGPAPMLPAEDVSKD
jgi:hypothetical protein